MQGTVYWSNDAIPGQLSTAESSMDTPQLTELVASNQYNARGRASIGIRNISRDYRWQ